MQNGGGEEGSRYHGEGNEEEDCLINPKPFNKLRYKMAKFNFQDEEKEAPLTTIEQSPTSPEVESPSTPNSINGYSSNSRSSLDCVSETGYKMKKLKIPPQAAAAAEEEISMTPKTPSPPRAPPTGLGSAIKFGSFSPSGSKSQSSDSKKSTIRIRVTGPKPPPASEPVKRLLAPDQTTYLRPRRTTVYACEPAPNSPMGPPESRISRTPYETVKKALTFLKSELGITTFPPSPPQAGELEPFMAISGWPMECAPQPKLPSYSLSDISSNSGFTVEEVIMELDQYVNSLPETISSDSMKAKLMNFQIKIGLPPRPPFYNLMWRSATTFLYHLADYFLYDSSQNF